MKYEFAFIFLAALLLSGCDTIGSRVQTNIVPNETANVTVTGNSTVDVALPSFDVKFPVNGNFTFYVLPTAGYSVFIRGVQNETVLVDTGTSADFNIIVKTLRNLGVEKIDAVVLTHNSPDTTGTLAALSTQFSIGRIYHNGLAEYFEPVQSLKSVIPSEAVSLDESKKIGSTLISFFVPYSGGYSDNDSENSIAVQAQYGAYKVLYLSSCSLDCEKKITANANLKSDVLIVAGKGSCDESSTFFLMKVAPAIAVSSDGFCSNLKSRLDNLNIAEYSVDINGMTGFSSSGSERFIIGKEKG